MNYVSLSQRRFEIANTVAVAYGLPETKADSGTLCEWTPEDDSYECPRCRRQMRACQQVWGVRTSHECDEWEFYCSPACASDLAPGTRNDFLERMGWTLWWQSDEDDGEFRWTKIAEDDETSRVLAREGDETWLADCVVASVLEDEVEDLLCASRASLTELA